MTEQLISLETAILAHKKGYDWGSEKYWLVNERIGLFKEWQGMPPYVADGCDNVYRPTQSLLQKWLRDVHQIYVSPMFVGPDTNLYHYRLDAFGQTAEFSSWFESWEECLEAGLKEALNLL